ncbi:helix-turn-helix domain-containing protein [Streptomyces olivoreticuli]
MREENTGAAPEAEDQETEPVDAARELRRLRQEQGISLAALSRRAFYSKGHLSKVENGEKPLTLDLARACDRALDTGGVLEELLPGARSDARADPETHASGVCPYRGLAAYRPDDARWFFGRAQATAHLLAKLTERLEEDGPLLVVAPSGAGKSSLLRAGLIPALARGVLPAAGSGRWPVILLTPGEHPVEQLLSRIAEATGASRSGLSRALARSARRLAATVSAAANPEPSPPPHWTAREAARVVLVIDQFEETFTLCQDPRERHTFIQALHALASRTQEDGRPERPAGLVVLGVRADFYGQCLAHPELVSALQNGHVPLGPMNLTQLRTAITGPAQEAGLDIEPGLTEILLRDATLTSNTTENTPDTPRPGILPLLSHALLTTWQHREDSTLTVAGYQLTGGISGAVAATAERAYTTLLPDQRNVARQLLLHLVRVDDTGETSHRMERDRLLRRAHEPRTAAAVLDVFARARLLTLDAEHVELAHEALLRAWPRLREWIDEDRTGLRTRQSLLDAAEAWDREGRDAALLYRGTRLALAREWAADPARRVTLGPVAQAFLDTGTRHEAAERKQERCRTRRLRQLVGSLAVLMALALVATGMAFRQRQTAITAQHEAQSRQLAAQSGALIDSDPDLASLLAIQAHRTSPTDEATAGLYAAAALPLRHRLTGHTDTVASVAYSPDGKTLATGSFDKTVRLWNTAGGELRKTLTGHTGMVNSVAFSPDGRTLATGSSDKTVRIWDATSGELRDTLIGHADTVAAVVFSPDGKTLATGGSDKSVRLWDMTTGKPRHVLTGHTGAVTSVVFGPDGKTLASASGDRSVRIWDAVKGEPRNTLTGHTDTVTSVAFSPDGKSLATGSIDKSVRLWDMAGGEPRNTLTGHTDTVMSVAFGPDGRTLATGSIDKTVRLWDTATGKSRSVLTGHTHHVASVAFSPDGRTLATGSFDKSVRLWNVAAGEPRITLTGHTGTVMSVAFSPDGRTLATTSGDRTVRLWDPADGGSRATLTGHTDTVTSVAFSSDGRTLATGSFDKTVRLWNTADGELRGVLTGNTDHVTSVAFSPDGRILATTSGDRTVRLWSVATGELRNTLTGHGDIVASVAFSPDGSTLATTSGDRTVRLWSVATGELRNTLTGHSDIVASVAFSPDGKTLATGSDDETVRIWDVATGKPRNILAGHTGPVISVAFGPDGETLATTSGDETVRIWNVTTGKPRNTLTGHTGRVTSVAFGPDGRTLAGAGSDRTVRLWDMDLPDATEAGRRICRALHRDFTKNERTSYLRGQTSAPVCPAAPPH